jgi:hypothetical protein
VILEKLLGACLDFPSRKARQVVHRPNNGENATLDIAACDIDAVEGLEDCTNEWAKDGERMWLMIGDKMAANCSSFNSRLRT